MASKNLKKYERHFLIGLVVLLLASFSITGALSFCHDTTGGRRIEAGGTFEPTPGEKVEISDSEFVERYDRQRSFLAAVRTPTLELYPFLSTVDQKNPFKQAWMAMAVGDAAEAAGYHAGPEQIKRALRDLIGARSSVAGRGGEFTNAAYQKFLLDEYRGGTQAEFESELGRMLMRDAYLSPLVMTTAYAATYEDLFEEWRKEHVKLDLEVIGLPSEPFADKVEAIERTRSAIADVAERLELVSRTARTLRQLELQAEKRREDDGAWPADMEAFAEGSPGIKDTADAWDTPVRYAVDGDTLDIRSAGPDKEMDTADDVTLATVGQLRALGALRQVGEAVVTWHKAADAWPDDIATLLMKPKPERLAPLSREADLDDPWGHRLTYVAPEGDGAATLSSAGPDGEAGTADDLTVEVPAEGFAVRPVGALASFVGDEAKDIWGNDLDVELSDGQLWSWRVTSRGSDGAAGTDDDVTSGNRMEMQDAYQDPVLRRELRVPEKRRFELVYVHLPLLTDEMLKTLWDRFPDQRPATEDEVWTYWRTNRELLFAAADPADPTSGYGATHMQEVAPDAPRNQVPGPDAFPAHLGPADEEKPGDEQPGEEKPEDPEAELRATYRDQGWRGIALRDMFVERVMAHLLDEARGSADAVAAWETKYRNAPEGTDVPPRPEIKTFGDLYAEKLADLEPSEEARAKGAKAFVHHVTNELVTDASWESNPDFGVPEIRRELDRLKGEDLYSSIPTQVALRTTKAILHGIQYEPATVPPMEDVREQVFAKHLDTSRLAYAVERLEELKKAVIAEGDADAEGAFERALSKWQEGLDGAPVTRETTGWFLGHGEATQEPVPDDASDDEKARLGRINTALRQGYAVVGRTPGGIEDEAAVGKMGRMILRDQDNGTALLVRVRAVEHASEAAFSPTRYVDVLRRKAYGERPRMGEDKPTPGAVQKMAERFYGNFDWFRRAFGLRVNSDLDALMQR